MEHNADRTPLIDISNTSVTGDQIGSNSLGPIDDANERKRQRDRERYATMSIEQKNEKNRKRREARQRNKGLPLKSESSRGPIKNTPLAGNSIERKRQRDRERRATMSVEQRNEYNNKRRQMRQRNKGQNVMPDVSGDGDKKENVDPDDDSDWLHRNETFQSNDYVATTDLLPPASTHLKMNPLKPSMGAEKQMYGQPSGVRPFGVSLLIAGYDDNGPQLYQVDPSGSYFSWKASAMGKKCVKCKDISWKEIHRGYRA
uniref:Uncharacterized protein n=1 Tax=Zea mays TaxID=4577 RepID=A0A804MSW3_MAIZE